MPIEISKIIVHKLNLNGDDALLSNHCISLDNLDDVDSALTFFTEHIYNMRDYGYTRKCRFFGAPANVVQNSISEVNNNLENPDEIENIFIEQSRIVAQSLRNVMNSSSSTSDGSLFFLMYTLDGDNYICLLKMDPNPGIQVTRDFNIVVRPEMLPSPNERLHKSAIIKMLDTYDDNTTHLFTLDRQRGNSEPSKFFMSDFLQARELANDINLTVQYQAAVHSELTEVIPPADFYEFSAAFKRTLNSGVAINIDEDLPRIIRDTVPALRDRDLTNEIRQVKEKVREKYPDATSNFDPVPNKVRPTVYKNQDKSIEIKIGPDVEERWYNKVENEETGEITFTFYEEAGVFRENK